MRLALLVLALSAVLRVCADASGKEVVYTADSLTLKGYLACNDSARGKRPAVLVVHEWWGHNDYARHRADMLAELGYVALAVDMYGGGRQADHPGDAAKFSSAVMQNMPGMKARFRAAMDLLMKDERVDPHRIAAIGYCFGGGVVLAMARDGADLRAVVSFHGSLATSHPAEKGKVRASVLACNGEDDTFISDEDIKNFKAEMKSAGANWKFVNYPGAVHSFTNPASTEMGKKFNLRMEYNEKADRESWSEMQGWLKKAFRK